MTKICQLLSSWPAGAVGVQPWLESKEIYRQLTKHYADHGWLTKIGGGAYVRSGEKVTWQGGIYALQQGLELPLHIGGLTSLELLGQAHFIPMGTRKLYLFAHSRHVPRYLPKWFLGLGQVSANYIPTLLFSSNVGLTDFNCGTFKIQISAMERALFELLSLVPDKTTFDHACLLMQYQNLLRADVVQQLLQECRSQTLKRLFLHLARKFNLDCLSRLNLKSIDLGRGVRHIGQGQVYDPDLKLYVPTINDDIENNVEVPDV